MPRLISVQPTPNPNAYKYILDCPLLSGSRTFTTVEDAADFPQIAGILALEGVLQVFALNDFITVTRKTGAEWMDLSPEVEVILTRESSPERT
jgi:hypothetical protein